jgi:hypothetical protein
MKPSIIRPVAEFVWERPVRTVGLTRPGGMGGVIISGQFELWIMRPGRFIRCLDRANARQGKLESVVCPRRFYDFVYVPGSASVLRARVTIVSTDRSGVEVD